MQVLRSAAARLQSQRASWEAKLHPDVRSVIGHLHLPFLQWLLEYSGFPAKDYVARLMRGKPCLGEIPASGIFFAERNEGTLSLKQWSSAPRSRNERMIAMTKSSGDNVLDNKSWEKTLKEIRMNYCDGPGEIHDLDLDRVCLTPRWAKWEEKEDGSWSCRNISDWKASKGNETVTILERYSPEDLTTAHAVIRILRQVFPHGTALQGYRVDWEMAFRQDPLWPGTADLQYELTWNPKLGRVQWVRPKGGAFGNKAAQLNFVQHPHFICYVARTQLAILLCHYSDDMWDIEPSSTAHQAHALVLEIMELIGWRYDTGKSPPPKDLLRLLGVNHQLGTDAVVWLAKEKVQKLLRQIQHHKQHNHLTSAEASSLNGSFNWFRSSLWGRSGAAVLTPLRARQKTGRFTALNSALKAMFEWLEHAMLQESMRTIACDIMCKELVVTVSDGEGTGNVAVGLWYVSRDDTCPRITATAVPSGLLDKWARHSANSIAPIEGLGPLLALATWPEISEKLWVHFIDNTSAKDSLIKGCSVNADLNEVMHATWQVVRARALHLWVEWVATKDNPIDQASRGNRKDLYSEGWVWDKPGDFMQWL
jgi:hypothetical protein